VRAAGEALSHFLKRAKSGMKTFTTLNVEKAIPLFFIRTAKVENLSKIPTNIVTPNKKIEENDYNPQKERKKAPSKKYRSFYPFFKLCL